MTDALLGCLLGTAVGDAMGLPYEGMARRRIPARIEGHRWLFGRGMISDDTEHTWIVLEALWRADGDAAAFGRELAWGLRWWFWALPAAAGFATVRACLKLSVGFGYSRSGVFSAGNGPAMRAAVIGVWFRDDLERMREFVGISTRITHTDPKAFVGALAVAMAAAGRVAELPAEAFGSRGREWGVSGYIYDTVPAVLEVVERYGEDYRGAVVAAIQLGGDTDTVAAIVGGIVGARVGEAGIPREWVDGVRDWPRSVAGMRRLAVGDIPRVSYSGAVGRNLVFFWIAVWHALRVMGGLG